MVRSLAERICFSAIRFGVGVEARPDEMMDGLVFAEWRSDLISRSCFDLRDGRIDGGSGVKSAGLMDRLIYRRMETGHSY